MPSSFNLEKFKSKKLALYLHPRGFFHADENCISGSQATEVSFGELGPCCPHCLEMPFGNGTDSSIYEALIELRSELTSFAQSPSFETWRELEIDSALLKRSENMDHPALQEIMRGFHTWARSVLNEGSKELFASAAGARTRELVRLLSLDRPVHPLAKISDSDRRILPPGPLEHIIDSYWSGCFRDGRIPSVKGLVAKLLEYHPYPEVDMLPVEVKLELLPSESFPAFVTRVWKEEVHRISGLYIERIGEALKAQAEEMLASPATEIAWFGLSAAPLIFMHEPSFSNGVDAVGFMQPSLLRYFKPAFHAPASESTPPPAEVLETAHRLNFDGMELEEAFASALIL